MKTTRQRPIVTVLRESITDQIEALILQSPECSRTASLGVDRLLLCADALPRPY